MNEILVKLYVPVIDEQYDIWIPLDKKISLIVKLLVKSVNELTKGYYVPNITPKLYDRENAKTFDVNLKVIETDIRNGSEIILL